MYLDYIGTMREQVKNRFFRVKKDFDVLWGKGHLEKGTIVGINIVNILPSFVDDAMRCCINIYPFFNKNCSVNLDKYVYAEFSVRGEPESWLDEMLDEWFEPAVEVEKVRQRYECLRKRFNEREDKICTAFTAVTFITGLVCIVYYAFRYGIVNNFFKSALTVISIGLTTILAVCILTFKISDSILRPKLEKLEQEFSSLVK